MHSVKGADNRSKHGMVELLNEKCSSRWSLLQTMIMARAILPALNSKLHYGQFWKFLSEKSSVDFESNGSIYTPTYE